MKKDIKASDIIIRLLLFFLWPFGVIPLAISRRIKHKICLTLIYFSLCSLIGFTALMYILLPFGAVSDGFDFSYGIAVAKDMSIQWFEYLLLSGGLWIVILLLIFSIVVYAWKIGKDKEIAQQEMLIADKKMGVDDFLQRQARSETAFQNAVWLTEEDKNYRNHFNSQYNEHSSNNNQHNKNNYQVYQKAQVLTEREKSFYETIRLIAEKYNLNVSAKMRLADIVNVSDDIQKQSSLWRSNFGKISQKHIDFALQDKTNLEIKLLIEIDDYTHQRADRIERDKFVDSVCKQANIPILHLYDVIGLEDKIVNILHSEKTEQEM